MTSIVLHNFVAFLRPQRVVSQEEIDSRSGDVDLGSLLRRHLDVETVRVETLAGLRIG